MADRTIARRYARAFIEIAEEVGNIEGLSQDLHKALSTVMAHDAAIYDALSNPAFTVEERKGVLREIAPRIGVGDLTRNLLFVLMDKGRFVLLPQVVEVFDGYADDRFGRVRVKVETAEPLTPQLETEVIAALQKVTGKDVLIDTSVDPELIGGLVARVGGIVYDASVKTRLENIKQRLLRGATPAQA